MSAVLNQENQQCTILKTYRLKFKWQMEVFPVLESSVIIAERLFQVISSFHKGPRAGQFVNSVVCSKNQIQVG